MRTWRSDPRFFCPHCRRIIVFAIGVDWDPRTNWFRLTAVCPDCQQMFREDEWRERHGPFRPRTDVRPGPASSSGES
jgi:hypothetical protein